MTNFTYLLISIFNAHYELVRELKGRVTHADMTQEYNRLLEEGAEEKDLKRALFQIETRKNIYVD